MSFFDSEVVRAEMAEISELQEEVYANVFNFPQMTKEDKLLHVSLLERLLNKQQILYTRLKLSDDPEAIKMKERVKESAQMMGLPEDVEGVPLCFGLLYLLMVFLTFLGLYLKTSLDSLYIIFPQQPIIHSRHSPFLHLPTILILHYAHLILMVYRPYFLWYLGLLRLSHYNQ